MSEIRNDDPFEDLKKYSNPKKAAKRDVSSIISSIRNRKRFDQKDISFKLAALLPVTFLLILLSISILTQTVSASGTPTAAFTASTTSGCSPLTTTFSETSNGNGYTITKWEWDFNGDGTIDRTDTTKPSAFAYTYTTPGIYTVTLKVTTAYGTNTKTRTNYITAQGSTADFTATPTSGCSPLTVTFTNAAQGIGKSITKWQWDFTGDGTIERTDTTAPSPFTYTYSTPGTYTVKLTTTTSCGTNTMTKNNYITAQGSNADFTVTPTSGCSPFTVTFTNAAQAVGATITKWQWDFNGDGTVERTDTSAPSPFAYTYNTPGIYTAKLTTTTSCGTNTMTKTGYVTAYGPPVADFTATATSGCAPLTVTFTNTSNANGRTITGWTWDFGDTTTFNGQTPPDHIYSSPGTYTVKLGVTSACGTNTKTKTNYITVCGPPAADFTTTTTSGCAPLTVTFTNTSSGNGRTITGWAWDFGDSATYNGQTPPNHIYSTPGTYTVKLTVTSACGSNTMTKTDYITAYRPPTANFTAIPNSGCPPLTVTFTNISNGNGRIITGWIWDFGDTTTFNGQTPPDHIYSNKGIYTVKLTVTSACGTDTKTAYVTVSQPVVVPGTYGPACVSASNITLGGSPVGGTWFGDGVSGDIFNPAVAGPGNHVLTYQYTSGSSCSYSNTTTLTVVPLPQTTITVG